MDSNLAEKYTEDEFGELREHVQFDLNAVKENGQGFKQQCFHCGQHGHRVARC